MKTKILTVILLLGFLNYQLAAFAGIKPPKGRCLAVLHFELVDQLIYLQVAVNGSTPRRFILDSGASVWVIDAGQVAGLGLVTKGSGKISGAGEGKVDVNYTDSVVFGLPPMKTMVPKVTIIDISKAVPGQKVDGLIGYDFFAQYVVEIDFRAKIIRLYDPKDYKYTGKGDRIRLNIRNKLIYVPATIKVAGHDAAEKEYLVDTGSSDTIDDDLVAQATTAKTGAVGGVGLGKQFKVVIGNVETFQIGKKVLNNLSGVSGGQKIGNGLLHSYKVIFDYSHKEMILE
jgi:hypothetical protein